MSAGTLLLALAPYGAALLLALLLIIEVTQMLVGRQHPLRVLAHVLSCGFFLLLAGLLVPIGGVLTVIWWVFVALALGAAAVALARSRVVAAGAVNARGGAEATTAVSRARSAPENAQTPARGTPEAAAAGKRRRRLRRATRPSVFELAISVVLFAGAVVLWILAG